MMKTKEKKIEYRYFGLEPRIIFGLIVCIFLMAGVFLILEGFLFVSVLSVFLFILGALAIILDYHHHKFIIDDKILLSEKINWKTLKLSKNTILWEEINSINTDVYGIFDLWKVSRITSKDEKHIVAFSFMEDYLHFLKDICKRSSETKIDKLTLDLIGGKEQV